MSVHTSRGDWKRLGLILLLALCFRVFAYSITYAIHRDGVHFYNLATDFVRGEYLTGLDRSTYHPLYPILIAAVGWGSGIDLETCGYLVSIFFSTVTLLPLFVWSRRVFCKEVAFVGLIFTAVNPTIVRCSSEVATEATYTFFFVSAVFFGWLGIKWGKVRNYLLSGVAIMFAFLTRPEGLAVILPIAVWTMVSGKTKPGGVSVRRLGLVLCLFLAFFLSATPFLYHIHQKTGRWSLSDKPPVTALVQDVKRAILAPLSIGQPEGGGNENREKGESLLERGLGALSTVANTSFMSVYPPFFILFLFSLRRLSKSRWHGVTLPEDSDSITVSSWFLLSIIGLYFLLFLRVIVVHGYFSTRYLVPLAVIIMPWAGAGAFDLRDWILGRYAKFKERPERYRRVVLTLIITTAVVMTLPKAFRRYHLDKAGERTAGVWIKEHDRTGPMIATDMIRIPHYAAGIGESLPAGGYSDFVGSLKARKIPYLVVADERITDLIPGFFSQVRAEDLEGIYSCPRDPTDPGGEQIIVYSVKQQSATERLDTGNGPKSAVR